LGQKMPQKILFRWDGGGKKEGGRELGF